MGVNALVLKLASRKASVFQTLTKKGVQRGPGWLTDAAHGAPAFVQGCAQWPALFGGTVGYGPPVTVGRARLSCCAPTIAATATAQAARSTHRPVV